MRKFSVTRADLKRILIAGTIVAVLDGTFAFCAYVVVAGRYNFESLLQYTASGLLGNDAFGHHGLTGWLIAALGATLHFAISFTVAAVFFVALRRFARTSERTVALGLLYGAGVWMFNAGACFPAQARATSRSSAAGTSHSSSITRCSWACRSHSCLLATPRG